MSIVGTLLFIIIINFKKLFKLSYVKVYVDELRFETWLPPFLIIRY